MIKRIISVLLISAMLLSLNFVVFSEETEKEYYHLKLTKINQQLLEAEDMTLDDNFARVEESEKCFNGKNVRLTKSNSGEAIGFNVTPSKVGQLAFWMRYSAESKNSNRITVTMEGKEWSI